MFHKNDVVNQYMVDKVLCQRYTVEHKELVYPACQRTSCYSKFFRALSQGCNVPQKRCCQPMCGGQGIVLEIYGGAQGISLPSLSKDKLLFKIFSSFVIGVQCSTKTMLSINMWQTRYKCARDIRWSTRNQFTQRHEVYNIL